MLEMIGVDAMIVGRGGGSLEDLWAFNEEAVAQAIFDCDVPIISAVGHETDTTIADFVADVRAETPSAAAQIAVCQIKNVTESIEELKRRLYKNISVSIESNRNRVELKKSNLLRLSPKRQIADRRFRLMQDEEHLKKSMLDIISMKRHELMIRSERLNGVSPLEKLKQGYSYAVDANSKNINSIERVNTGDSFDLYVTDGIISAAVTKKEKKEI